MKHAKNAIAVAAITMIFAAGCATVKESAADTRSKEGDAQCANANETEIAALFDRWNASLTTGDPRKVVANYATKSVLLATFDNQPLLTPEQKTVYFTEFLKKRPVAHIPDRQRWIAIGCVFASDTGLYTFNLRASGRELPARFTFVYRWDGRQWLIISHHSSEMPEKPAVP